MSIITYRKDLKEKARELRVNMTKEERHLWYDFLKTYTPPFYRQRPIGNYIVDFYCAKAKLAIELDGGQHFEESGLAYDKDRTDFIGKYGIEVLRFSNLDIWQHFHNVCEEINEVVKQRIDK